MVFILLWRHGRGNNVGLRVSPWGENLMLRKWVYLFGIAHTVLWFDELVGCNDDKSRKRVFVGMFAWAVRCRIFGRGRFVCELGEGWSVIVPAGGVVPWSRLGRCYSHGVYQVCYLFYLDL